MTGGMGGLPFDPGQLALRFDAADVSAIALMGSYARGDAGPYSDIDLVRFVGAAPATPRAGTYLIGGRLVVVSDVLLSEIEGTFSRPEVAVTTIAGLRSAQPLLDRNGVLGVLQKRARAFVWDAEMQARADVWASKQMLGWIEEVHKGLEGLQRNDPGRLLNARFGLSWGLSRVVQVQRGVLLSGDNAFYTEVEAAVGANSPWARLRRAAFGYEFDTPAPPPLRDQVVAGLRLYALTAILLAQALQPEDRPLIDATVALITTVVGLES